jgi:hypothetical protein
MIGVCARSLFAVLVLVACSGAGGGAGAVPAPARQSAVTTDVVYGHKDGLALTLDVHRPAQPNGAGVIAIVSGGWQSSVEMSRMIADGYIAPLLNAKGFTVFAVVRHRVRQPRSW